MLDILTLPLHAGTEHPNLSWIVLSSLLSFVLGLGIGTYSDRFREVARAVSSRTDR